MNYFLVILSLSLISCSNLTDPELKKSPTGVWRTTNGAAFNYLVLFEDNTFLYAENDLTALSPEENGLEVGTYTFNPESGNIRFSITYDDNDPGNDSGIGDIGTPVATDALLSDGDTKLTVAGGALVLSSANTSASSAIVGVWRAIDGAAFNYLALFADNTFLYAENDLTVLSPEENGLEVGTYTFDPDAGNIRFSLTYDDNDPGNDSGIGDIGILVATDVVLSDGDSTLSVASGSLILFKEF